MRLLLCSLLLLALVPAAHAQDDPDPTRFEDAIEAFRAWDRKNAAPDDPVLFVGSSSMVFWPSAERFPDLPVVNRGFGGSHFSDLLHYFDDVVTPYEPRIIVVYEGDNDVSGGKPAERVRDDYQAFVQRVHERWPETAIIYVPIKPSRARWAQWPEMERANALIAEISATDDRLHVADIATPMLATGTPPDASLFVEDGLHLSADGYTMWTGVLRPLLDRLLSE